MPQDHSTSEHLAEPVSFAELIALAENLRWTWHMDVRSLFAALFADASPGQLEWPVRLLIEAGPKAVEARLREHPGLDALARAVVEDRSDYLDDAPDTWYPTTHDTTPLEVAYFSAEFALTDSLPIFAGGLGAIAGEQLKSSSALGVPLLGVGLLYRESSHQWLDEDRLQQESWEVLNPSALPVTLARGVDGRPLTVSIPFPGRDVVAQLWTAPVGRTWLYLLDTNVPQNFLEDQAITARLYGGTLETRIQQELVLGIGGLRAIQKFGHNPTVLHLNEGHTAFAALQHIASISARHDNLQFDVARRIAAAQMVFTTHTPVAAGHDYFPPELAAPYLEPYGRLLGIDLESLLQLGRYRPGDPTDTFCPTVLALRLTDTHNGVSRLHGSVTRQQWGGLWPRVPTDEVPIGHVTNGVHLQSWITPEFDRLLDRQLGEDWRRVPGEPESWTPLLEAGDVELWSARRAARARLVAATRERRRALLALRGEGSDAFLAVEDLLDPNALTIGFVGRFVAYKRPTLFLRDPERFARLLSDVEHPVQVVFAGKAHPNDEHGKRLLRSVTDFAADYGVEHRLVFIEDFDLTADRALAQGVDLWLNTPRRPLEACGIGGMKAGMNGSLNLSTLDGWWDEVWNDQDVDAPPIGWCIGTAEAFEDHDAQDELDAASLYERLEQDIVPCFYERDEAGLPSRWLDSVRQSMATLADTWRSHRMVQQYVDGSYVPGATRARRLAQYGAVGAWRLSDAIERFERAWPMVHVQVVAVEVSDNDVTVDVAVHVGELDATEVTVDVWVTVHDDAGRAVEANLVSRGDGVARFRGTVQGGPTDAGAYAARVLPRIDDAPSRFVPGLIAWSS